MSDPYALNRLSPVGGVTESILSSSSMSWKNRSEYVCKVTENDLKKYVIEFIGTSFDNMDFSYKLKQSLLLYMYVIGKDDSAVPMGSFGLGIYATRILMTDSDHVLSIVARPDLLLSVIGLHRTICGLNDDNLMKLYDETFKKNFIAVCEFSDTHGLHQLMIHSMLPVMKTALETNSRDVERKYKVFDAEIDQSGLRYVFYNFNKT